MSLKKIKSILNLDNRYVLSCNTGFSALHLALISLNLKPNHEIIILSFSNVANLQTILNLNLRPVFCDVEDDSLCIDTNKLELKVNKNTKAIMFIDYACNLANYKKIKKIANKYGFKSYSRCSTFIWIEIYFKNIGNIFDYTMFSFDPIKKQLHQLMEVL